MIVPAQIITNATAQLRAALEPLGVEVYRRRERAINESTERALVVRLAGCRGERYGVDGSTTWTTTLRLLAFGRDSETQGADEVAGEVLEAAHVALMATPGLGIPGLDVDNGFSMSEDDEDFDDEMTGLVALYEYQISTQGLSAASP